MRGCNSKIAGGFRKLGVIEELNNFIWEQLSNRAESSGTFVSSRSQIQPILQIVERRSRMQKLHADMIARRIQNQRDAVSGRHSRHCTLDLTDGDMCNADSRR